MVIYPNLAVLLTARLAGGPDVQRNILGILPIEDHTGGKPKSTIVELYDELRPSLFGYLICLGLTSHQADDVIQEAFLNLFQHLESSGRDDNLRGWVFRVAHNLSRNLQRRERRLVSESDREDGSLAVEQADDAPNPEEVYLWKEHVERLDAVIGQLTEQQRQCLHLRATGLRYREIAGVLGISVSRIPQLLQRAMVRIMDELNG
jgi:RNA polymerase sigma-70 factor, ECF subfamily